MIPVVAVIAAIFVATGWSDDFDRGYRAHVSGEPGVALYHYDRALDEGRLSQSNKARIFNNRGVAHEQLGHFHQALADFEAAMRHAPGDQKILHNRTLVRSKIEADNGSRRNAAAAPAAGVHSADYVARLRERASLLERL